MLRNVQVAFFFTFVLISSWLTSSSLLLFSRDKLPFDDCVVDFAWFPKGKSPQFTSGEMRNVWVIEINPFVSNVGAPQSSLISLNLSTYQKDTTGASLFDWSRDAEVLKNGPFEFRLLTKPPEHNYEGFISNEWRELLAEVLIRAFFYIFFQIFLFQAKLRLDQANAQRDLGQLHPSMAAQCLLS